eukprot:CAMPEP_0113421264 /NCGR_PEP_ID=MMETSP0013_2-20120614/27790_1 /TAXON_ID=2843 ORGANISM="Skeletonema costatum, Strain 1716" /NCGR_SAMPLE_ID=MMETSP0013_2 /ASSEMBLY_ACC=CAM_ASM_000158 /LENGTH=75 /DNA_ID=CAMNT_0000308841 /DNA_START=109 /DNA_END=336 /DNA_ORIENTATION=- /assembly_acc=CAM_ASM_000158
MTRALGNNRPKSPPSSSPSPLRSIENEMNMILDEDFSFKPIYSILGKDNTEQWSCHYLLKDGAVARVSNPLAKSR